MAKNIQNLRIDTRGHILAVQIADLALPDNDWWWYNLDGDVLSSGTGEALKKQVYGLRLDTRGHVVAVLKGDGTYWYWFDLDGNNLGRQVTFKAMYHLRIDTRGHVLAIGLFETPDTEWYDLNGEAA